MSSVQFGRHVVRDLQTVQLLHCFLVLLLWERSSRSLTQLQVQPVCTVGPGSLGGGGVTELKLQGSKEKSVGMVKTWFKNKVFVRHLLSSSSC